MDQKIDENGNDLLVAKFHTGARDTFNYNDILSALRQEENIQEEAYFTVEEVLDHKPLKDGVPLNKAKQWLVKIKWNREEEPTWKLLSVLRQDDPMTLAAYAHEQN